MQWATASVGCDRPWGCRVPCCFLVYSLELVSLMYVACFIDVSLLSFCFVAVLVKFCLQNADIMIT